MFRILWIVALSALQLTTVSTGQQARDQPSDKLTILIQKARRGNPQAQFELGSSYESGTSVKQDIAEAFRWYRRAAEGGLPEAQFKLGSSYEFGVYGRSGAIIKPNRDEAIMWYRKAAEQSDVKAEFRLGYIYASGMQSQRNPAEALLWLHKAADQGDNEALYELGVGYEYGIFGPRDDAEALSWYRKAAEQGNKSAAYVIGQKYFDGTGGVKQDFAEAARWFGCPKPSEAILASCRSISYDDLPRGARDLLNKMKCEVRTGSNYDYGSAVDLNGNGTPAYEFCCSEAPHGPCGAVLIGKIGEEWKELGSLLGFTGPCGCFVVLDSQHNGFHDVCLPNECSTPIKNNVCVGPAIWQFSNGRYRSVANTTLKTPQ